jgi:hypothetical protein
MAHHNRKRARAYIEKIKKIPGSSTRRHSEFRDKTYYWLSDLLEEINKDNEDRK